MKQMMLKILLLVKK